MSDLSQTYTSPYDYVKSNITLPQGATLTSRIPKNNTMSVPLIDPGKDKRNVNILFDQMTNLGLKPKITNGYIEIQQRKSWDNELALINTIKRIESKATSSSNQRQNGQVALPSPNQMPKVDTLTELKAISKLDPRVPNLLYNQALKDFAEKRLTVDEFRNVQAKVTESNAQFNPTKYAFRGRNEAPLLAEESGFTIKPKMIYTGSYTI